MNLAEAHILKQEEPYKSIMLQLQILIEHTLPEAKLLYKWGMLCYYIEKKPICYLHKSKDFVDVGFWHAAHLPKQWDPYLISEKRKVVKSLRYKTLNALDDVVFISILKALEKVQVKGFYKKN
ncbi:DUF1801 domain-containing protein [Winogradskyella rapida]|uniref:DUF1801 domain-containing protein n=1 Tax=Winogradskyella rapida TaxID=549701 RepID=A0ABW3KQG5_9FLAO